MAISIDSMSLRLRSALVNNSAAEANVVMAGRQTDVLLNLVRPIDPGGMASVHLELSADDLQSPPQLTPDGTHSHVDFLFYVRPTTSVQNLSLVVVLPPEATLSPTSVSPVYPRGYENSTDGMSLVFEWRIPVLEPGQERVFIVRYQVPNLGTPGAPVIGPVSLGLAAICFALGVGLGISWPRITRLARRARPVRLVGLTEDEQEVLGAIRNRGGSCFQKELYTGLGLSQSRVSMILTALEAHGLIKRFREGRENIVYIVED